MKEIIGELKKWSREILIAGVLGLTLALAILIIIWGQEKSVMYRPLVQDITLTDSVKVADILDINDITYYADIKNHILYVDIAETERARVALAKSGIVIDYPVIKLTEDLQESYNLLLSTLEKSDENTPVYEQKWFHPFIKTISSMIVIIVLIFSLVRPALRALIYPEEEKTKSD